MELDDLQKEFESRPSGMEDWVDAEFTDPDEQALIDLKAATKLLKSSKILLDYIADPLLSRAVNKFTRSQIDKVSESIRMFLVEYEAAGYDEVE
jgi:hypothetical protein